jgi:hypothetical protein
MSHAILENPWGKEAYTQEIKPPTRNSADFTAERGSLEEGWKSRIDDLLGLRDLEDDWDGQGAPAPDKDLVDAALRLATLLSRSECPLPDRAICGLSGTVIFEWHFDHAYTELEVTSATEVECRTLCLTTRSTQEFFFSI